MEKLTELRLNRLDENQKTTTIWLEGLDNRIAEIGRDIAQIQATIQPRDLPWAVRFLLLPLAVVAAAATVGAVVHLEIAMAGMRNNVAGVQGELARQTVTADAALPASEFKAALPELGPAIAATRRQKLKVSPKVVSDLQQHLTATDADKTPSFWPTVAEFISFKSFNSASWAAPANLRACTDSAPTPATVKEVQSPRQMTINPGVYENCRFTLDSPQEDERLNSFLTHSTPQIAFKHCVIVYRGGTINLIISLDERNASYTVGSSEHPMGTGTVNVSVANTLEFRDCLFDLVLHNAPPQPGRQLTQLLLAATDTTITVPIATHS